MKSQKMKLTNRFRQTILIGVMIIFIGIMSISLVGAYEFDNVAVTSKGINTKYSDISWKNNWDLPLIGYTIADAKFVDNTDMCGNVCSSTFELTTYVDYTNPIKNFKYKVYNSKTKTWSSTSNTLNVKLYVQTGETERKVPYYTEKCIKNEKTGICESVRGEDIIVQEPIWTELKAEDNLKAGKYNIKVEGTKKSYETVDWIADFFGVTNTEWATWSGYNDKNDKLLFYKMNSGSGTTAYDETGNYNGTFNGTAVVWGSSFAGVGYNNASYLSSTELATGLTLTDVQAGNFSLEFRMNVSQVNDFLVGIGKRDPKGFEMVIQGDGKIAFAFSDGCGQTNPVAGDPILNDGKVHHIVVTRADANWSFYTDGLILKSKTCNLAGAIPSQMQFGQDPDGYWGGTAHVGGLEQVIFWNRTLTPAEILSANNSDTDGSFTSPSINLSLGVTLNSPVDYYNSSKNTNWFYSNATMVNGNLTNATLYIWNGGVTTNFTTIVGLPLTASTNISLTKVDGTYTWNVKYCGTNTTTAICAFASTNRTLKIDTTSPAITIVSPSGVVNYGGNGINITLNYSVIDTNLQSCWYNYNNTNSTPISCTNATQNLANITISQNNVKTIEYYAGSGGKCLEAAILHSRNLSTISPISNWISGGLLYISGADYILATNSSGIYTIYNTSSSGPYGVYNVGSSTYSEIEAKWQTSTACTAYNIFGKIFINSLIVYANDTSGLLSSQSTSWTYNFFKNALTYNPIVYETSSQNFTLNFTANNPQLLTTASFYYNNSLYPSSVNCQGLDCIVSSNIDVPLVANRISQINNFYWVINTYDGINQYIFNSETNSQTVNVINMTSCTSGMIALNFTAYDEQNQTQINSFDFEGNFNYYLGGGSTYRTLNISNTNAKEIDICLDLNTTYYVNSIIAYSTPNLTGMYPTRNWFYQNYPINDVMQLVPMYLLKTSSSTSFILQVQDNNLLPVGQVLVEPQRCYPGTNTNPTIFKSRTDNNGLTTGNFEAGTALYQFYITNQSRTILAVTPCSPIVPQTTPYTIQFLLGQGYNSPFVNINNATQITSNTVFNSQTKSVTSTYTDTSGSFVSAELFVQSLNASGNTNPLVCYATNNLSSGIMVCNLTQTSGDYFAQTIVHRSNQNVVEQIVFAIENFSKTVGYYGVFLGFFIILISAFAFKFNEIAGIWLVIVACTFCNIIGLIAFGKVFITALICVGIVITVVLER